MLRPHEAAVKSSTLTSVAGQVFAPESFATRWLKMWCVWPLRLSVPASYQVAQSALQQIPLHGRTMTGRLVTPRLSPPGIALTPCVVCVVAFQGFQGKLSLVGEGEPAHVSVKCQASNTYKHLCTHIHKEGGRRGGRGSISQKIPSLPNCKGKVWRLWKLHLSSSRSPWKPWNQTWSPAELFVSSMNSHKRTKSPGLWVNKTRTSQIDKYNTPLPNTIPGYTRTLPSHGQMYLCAKIAMLGPAMGSFLQREDIYEFCRLLSDNF